MTQIVVEPQQLADVGNQFQSKRGELETLIQQAKTYVNNLQGAWKGNRATTFFSNYASMEPNLKAAMETLQRTSELLKTASADFAQVDNIR